MFGSIASTWYPACTKRCTVPTCGVHRIAVGGVSGWLGVPELAVHVTQIHGRRSGAVSGDMPASSIEPIITPEPSVLFRGVQPPLEAIFWHCGGSNGNQELGFRLAMVRASNGERGSTVGHRVLIKYVLRLPAFLR